MKSRCPCESSALRSSYLSQPRVAIRLMEMFKQQSLVVCCFSMICCCCLMVWCCSNISVHSSHCCYCHCCYCHVVIVIVVIAIVVIVTVVIVIDVIVIVVMAIDVLAIVVILIVVIAIIDCHRQSTNENSTAKATINKQNIEQKQNINNSIHNQTKKLKRQKSLDNKTRFNNQTQEQQ